MEHKDNVSHTANRLFAIVYEDDGPKGVCAQSIDVTAPWKKLYLFDTEYAMRKFMKGVEKHRYVFRKNARITHVFDPRSLSNGVDFIAG